MARSAVATWKHADRPMHWRLTGLDRLRGLAVLLMVLDHVWLLLEGPPVVRYTLTRLAMPLFALIAGYLCRRLSRRWLIVAGWGVVLPALVPWVDAPNILLELSLGAVVVVAVRSWRFGPLLGFAVIAYALTVAANGLLVPHGSYQLGAVVALMLLGSRDGDLLAGIGGRYLPAWLELAGRWPLTIYVGHLLILEGLRRAA